MSKQTKKEPAKKPEAEKAPEVTEPEAVEVPLDPIEDFERRHANDIAWRIKAGLTKSQAIDVVREQVRHESRAKTKEVK